MNKLEQLNIEGKRSGEGFVAHKAMLVSALSMALSARVVLMDFTIGLKGFLGYLKALGGSNIVKVVPSNGGASGSQTNGHKRLKVICGVNTSYLADTDWIGDKTPLTFCEVRVSPSNSVKPNVGANELAEAFNRVLPFTATDDARPVLQCVNFEAKDGKLTLVSADGFTLAVVALDYDGEGQALIDRDDLKGVASALRRAKRVKISFEEANAIIIDTELTRYKWVTAKGSFPKWQKLIPTEFNTFASFDTVEAIKACNSLKVLSNAKAYPIDLTIGDGKIVMANPEEKGQAELVADTDGEGKIRVDGGYLASVLKACGGMVDFRLTNAHSPMLFSQNGYQVVVMPMLTEEAKKAEQEARKAKAEAEAKAEFTEPTEQAEKTTEPVSPVAEKPKKAKHSRAKKPVTA